MSHIAPDNARLEAEDKAHISHVELPIDSTMDKKERQKLKWKLDLFVLPLISSVYFFASMVDEICPQYYDGSKAYL